MALSFAVMIVDAHLEVFQPLRSVAGLALTPLYWVSDLPVRAYNDLTQVFTGRTELLAENEKLRAETLLVQRRLQKLALLTEQNTRLRELLNSAALVDDRVLVAELIGTDPNPHTLKVIINKGSQQGVYIGQPVLDARGVVGQVVEVMPFTARVLLITDTTHSLPVQVNRNGLRAIASGSGKQDSIELRFLADVADIKEGDLLVTSGMGQRFPAGYPVAAVTEVVRGTGQPFATVSAVPAAALNRSRYLLLVFADAENASSELSLDLAPDAMSEALDSAAEALEADVQSAPLTPEAENGHD